MKTILTFLVLFVSHIAIQAQIETYLWPAGSELISNSKYDIKVRSLNTDDEYGEWITLNSFYSYQRQYADHWKVGGDAGSDFMADRSLTFVEFAFTGIIELEVTQKLSAQKAKSVEISPKAYALKPHYFDGKIVRFIMNSQEYVSVNFSFGSNDTSINRDDNRAGGFDIRHGCMIFTELPESDIPSGYTVPKPGDAGVVVWDNTTDLSTIRNADIIYFPEGEHYMRNHKDRWERNSSWEKSEAEGNWVTTTTEYNNAHLYRGRLNLGKNGQKVYLAPGAIVYGGFHSHGHDNCWIYGRGIISGRKHLMHEIVKPDGNIAETQAYNLETKTKEAFCHFGNGARYDGVIFHEAWHHTCPSGQNTDIQRVKIIGWCSNNDGIRPASGSTIDKIFIKTSDDYDYARDPHTVRNAVMWPGVNGAIGQLGWNNLGTGHAEYYNMHIINSEWHTSTIAEKSNVGIVNGGKADAGIKLKDNIYQDMYIEDRTNWLVCVKTSGTSTGYLDNFTLKNITTEYPLSNPTGVKVLQEMRGSGNTWVQNWTYTNVFIDGALLTWENHNNYFNLNLTGSNGTNTDNNAKCKNVTFNTAGEIFEITYTKTNGGSIRPAGKNNVIQIAEGMNQTVVIAPNDGHRISSITVDGELQYEFENREAINRQPYWKFENVSADHTIDVVFAEGDDYFTLSKDTTFFYRNPDKPVDDSAGIGYLAYQGDWDVIPVFDTIFPTDTGVVDSLHANIPGFTEHFGAAYFGYIRAPYPGDYMFTLKANDGARFTIGEELQLELDGLNTLDTLVTDTFKLKAGKHIFKLDYFQKAGNYGLQLFWESDSIGFSEIPATAYTYVPLPEIDTIRPNVSDLQMFIYDSTSLILQWTESNENEQGFIIERSIYGEDSFVTVANTPPNTTTFIDTTVQEFTHYEYRIKTSFGSVKSIPTEVVYGRSPKTGLTTLPAPWSNISFGDTLRALASNGFVESGIFTIDAGDGDFWGETCRGHFIYQPYTGNCEIIAQLTDFAHAQGYSMAGVMIREQLTADSKFAASLMISEPGPVMRERIATSGATNQKPLSKTGEQAPYWVRLVRNGNNFTAYTGADGITWKQTRSVTIDMDTSFYAGLAATTHTNMGVGDYVFENVELLKYNSLHNNLISNITIYPNPANGMVYIEVGTEINARLQIYNLTGELVKTALVTKCRTQIDIQSLNKGVYFLKLTEGNHSFTQKLLVY